MADVTLFNTDTVPVHLDAEGRVLGAGEHGTGNLEDPTIAEAVAAGRLLVVHHDHPSEAADEAVEAVQGGGEKRRTARHTQGS